MSGNAKAGLWPAGFGFCAKDLLVANEKFTKSRTVKIKQLSKESGKLTSHNSEGQHVNRLASGKNRRTVVEDHRLGLETHYAFDARSVAFTVVDHGPEHGAGPLRDYRESFAIGWRSLEVMEHVRD